MMNVPFIDLKALSVSYTLAAARRTMIAGNSPREPPMIPSTAAAVADPGRFGPLGWAAAPYGVDVCQDGAMFWGDGTQGAGDGAGGGPWG